MSLESPIRLISLFRAIAKKLSHRASIGKTFESYDNRFNWTREHWQQISDDIDSELENLCDYLPSGSGIDSGTKLDESSKPERLVFTFGFHHMDEDGYYDGWTEHTAIVTPSLANEYELRITGRNRNDIKDYLHETFDSVLNHPVDEYRVARENRLGKERYRRLLDLSRENPTVQHDV